MESHPFVKLGMTATISLNLSVIAIAFSIYVFIESRGRDKRDVLIKMHEMLISDDLERARYLLFEKVVDEASVQNLSEQESRDVNRVISAYNLLGIYLKNGYVKEQDVMDAWGRSIYRAWMTAQPFLDHRENHYGYRPAQYFGVLAHRAKEYLSRNGNRPPTQCACVLPVQGSCSRA